MFNSAAQDLTPRENRAVEKMVRLGDSLGVTPEEMIAMLDSGCTIRDLLSLLAGKSSGAA